MSTQNRDVYPPRFNFERWLWMWHVLMYVALAVALVDVLILSPVPAASVAPVVILSALFAAWYAVCIVIKYEVFERNLPLLLGYFAVGWGIWFWLTSYEMMFMMLLVGLYPQVFGMPPTRWKIIGSVILTILSAWRQTMVMGASWVYLSVAALSTAAAIALALFIEAVIHQSEGRRELIEELQATRNSLASAERQAGTLEERQRLAREIHDTLAQGFTSIIMHLETMEPILESDPAASQKHLDQARRTARESLAEARRMVWALQPEALERASLAEVLHRLSERWSEENHIQASAIVTGAARASMPEIEVTLLRVAQESLANIRKHAKAGSVTLTLSYMDDLVALDIHDDGAGFDLKRALAQPDGSQAGGFGLRSMRERVEMLGGTLSIESAPGEGTTVAVALPV